VAPGADFFADITAGVRAARETRPRMGRFIHRFSDEQKDAILKARLVDRLRVPEIQRRARDGQLGVPAFEIGDYAYQVIKRGQADYEERNDDALAQSTADTLKAAHRANLKALRGLGDDADPGERARLAKHVAETWRAMGAAGAKPKPVRQKAEPVAVADGDDVLAGLLKNAKGPHKGGPSNGNGTG
jgi:hypothetical protein